MQSSSRWLCCAVLTLLGGLPLSSTEIPIDGRVRDSGGVGLAGVRVELRPILSTYEQGVRELEGRPVEPAARTVTGSDGRFQVSAPGEGMWEVGVFADGFVPLRYRLTPLTGPEILPSVRLRRDAGLRVRVVGPDGQPLSGARVVGRAWRGDWPGWETVPRLAVSGSDGVARLAASRDESLLLLATAPGFPVQEGPEVRGPAEVTLRLAAGTPRRVEAPDGALLRDLQTSLVLGRGGDEVVVRGESWLLLETADGVRVRFAVQDGPVRVEVPAPAVLPGRVIDTVNRQPVAGAWVWVKDDPGRFVRTDGQGGYRIHAAADLEIAAAGHLPEVVDRWVPRPEGALPPVALDPAVVLAGTVVDREGRPAAGAEVLVFERTDGWFPISEDRVPARAGRVSAGGEVRIGGLRPGSVHDLVISGPGFAPAWLTDGRLKARENRFRATLSRAGRVSGRIEDGQGRPVAEAEVRIETGAGIAKPILRDPAGESKRFAVTGPDGGFAIADVLPGWYEMTVRRPGAVAQQVPRFEAREGGADLGAVRLDEAQVLAARVVDPEGRPVAGAEVWTGWDSGAERWPEAVSGPDGGFSLSASRGQELEMTVCAPGFVLLGVSLPEQLPDEPLVLTVRPGASVSGRVTGPDGFPLAGHPASAALIGSAGAVPFQDCDGQGWSAADEAGRFRITGLEPGLYEMNYEERLALAGGESRELAFQKDWGKARSGFLSGRLLGNDGSPIPGAEISLGVTEDHGSFFRSYGTTSRTDADGSYRLAFERPGLKIDESSLGVTRHGRTFIWSSFSEWTGPKTVEADGRFDVVLENYPEPLEAAAEAVFQEERQEPGPVSTVSGRILGLEPGELARVRVTAGLGWPVEPTVGSAGPDGTWRLEGLPRKSWWIRAQAGDRVVFDAVHIPEGEARIHRDLVFAPVAEVHGQIETVENQPVAGATVFFRHRAGVFEMQRPRASVPSRSDGEFSARLPPGEYEVWAERKGFVPDAPDYADVVTVEEGKGDSAWIRMRPAVALSGRLSGLPADESDVDIEATRVDDEPGPKRPLEGKMVAEGRYVIPGLGPGTWEVEARYDRIGLGRQRATGRVEISEEATEAELDLVFPEAKD